MRFDVTEATAGVQAMVNGFIERLPYLLIAFVAFVLFYIAGRLVRAGARRLPVADER